MSSCSHDLLLCEGDGVKESLHWGFAETPAPLMRAVFVVPSDPSIEIGLQFLDRAIDLLAERHAVELIQHRPVEALANAIGLWALRLGPAVIDVLDGQVQLVFVTLAAAEFG